MYICTTKWRHCSFPILECVESAATSCLDSPGVSCSSQQRSRPTFYLSLESDPLEELILLQTCASAFTKKLGNNMRFRSLSTLNRTTTSNPDNCHWTFLILYLLLREVTDILELSFLKVNTAVRQWHASNFRIQIKHSIALNYRVRPNHSKKKKKKKKPTLYEMTVKFYY